MLLGGFGGTTGRGHRVADVLGFPEGLHRHGVHGREVCLDGLDAPVRVADTEVLLQVERVLGYPERIPHVGPHHLQALHALLAGVAVWRQSLIGKFYIKLLKSPSFN